jgi:type I restriction enzyme S subunit
VTWATAALRDVCDIVSGSTPLTSEKTFWGGNILWTTPKDLSDLDGAYLDSPPRTITEEGLKSCAASLLPKNSVLLSSRAPIGLVAINTVPMATNQGFKSLVPDRQKLDSKFLYHWLKSRTSFLQGLGNGATFKEISKAVVERIEIPLPPLNEQRRIAAILDKADALRRKRRDAELLIGELSDARFVSMFGLCKPSRAKWPTSKVSEVGKVQLGRQRAPKYQTGKFRKPYVRVANVYEDRIDTADILQMDFNENDFRDYKLEYGDILLNEGQSTELVGRPAMWRSEIEDCCFQNTLVRFQVDRERVAPEFALALFLRYFRAGEFAKISSKTSSVAHLGAGRFALMPFPLPPIKLQREFAEGVIAINKLKDQYRANTLQIDALFSSLQHRAFSGQL